MYLGRYDVVWNIFLMVRIVVCMLLCIDVVCLFLSQWRDPKTLRSCDKKAILIEDKRRTKQL